MKKHKKYKKITSEYKKFNYVFFLLMLLSISLTLIYAVGLDIPLPLTQKNIEIQILNLNTSFNLYKVYVPRGSLQSDVNLEIGLVIDEVGVYNSKLNPIYLDLGVHRIAVDKEIIFINTSSYVILNASKKYFVYLRVNGVNTNIPVAYIDDKYTKSFDSVVNYYPYQFHFIIRVQKCGVKLYHNNLFNKYLVKIVNEDGSSGSIAVEITRFSRNDYFVNICGDYIEVEGYSSPIPLILVKNSKSRFFVVARESPLILLIGLLIFAYAFILRFKETKKKIRR